MKQFGEFLKSLVRSEVLSHLQSLTLEEKTRASSQIQNQLQKELQSATGVWAGYKALSTEPDIDWNIVAPHLTWVFPVAEGQSLNFKIPSKGFKRATMGFLEPDGDGVDLTEISGFVVPGLGFDKSGCRLGRGGGYYDRALAGSAHTKIGVCFEVSLLSEIPFENHDVRCDKIITEKNVYVVRAEGEQKWN